MEKELGARTRVISRQREKIELTPVGIVKVESKGMGDRCCIDTTSRIDKSLGLGKGSGMLVGSSVKGMFLVHSENIDNPYVNKRQFRVNAGPVSMYTFVPPRDENGAYPTKYLCELKPGDSVSVFDGEGHVAEAVVARNKIERRPLTMVVALHPNLKNIYTRGLEYIYTFMQTAETINLVNEKGDPAPLKDLKRGDKVMAFTPMAAEASRHFGTPVKSMEVIENPCFGPM